MYPMIRNLRLLSVSLLCSFVLYLLLLNRLLQRIGLQPQSAVLTVLLIFYLAVMLFFWGRMVLADGSLRDVRILLALYGVLPLICLFHFSSGQSGLLVNPIGFILTLRDTPAVWPTIIIQLLLYVPAPYLLQKSGVSRTFIGSCLLAMGFAFAVELLQLVLKRGVLDLSDMLLYLIGFVLGYGLIGFRKSGDRHAA